MFQSLPAQLVALLFMSAHGDVISKLTHSFHIFVSLNRQSGRFGDQLVS